MVPLNRINHLFDCAGVGATLVREAKRHQLPWTQIQGPWMRDNAPLARYWFLDELALSFPRMEPWHVHRGGRAKWVRGRFDRRAGGASAAGVRLVPTMDVKNFLAELSTAQVAVGQTAGTLATSEPQALTIGVPPLFPEPCAEYLSQRDSGALVVERADMADAVVQVLRDLSDASHTLGGKEYTERYHYPARLVSRLTDVYQDVAGDKTEHTVKK